MRSKREASSFRVSGHWNLPGGVRMVPGARHGPNVCPSALIGWRRPVNVAPTRRLSPYPGREHSDANRDPGNESCNTIGRTVYNAAERELHRPLVVAKLPYTAACSAFSKVCSWRPPSNRRSGSHWANDIAHLGCNSIVVIANSCALPKIS
jgi:hypothetical protein